MNLVRMVGCILVAGTISLAQESGIHVRMIRVLATDPEAIAIFYEKAFGMSEILRPVTTATVLEIVVNSGSTVDLAKQATATPIIIRTRPKDVLAGAMASLILQVPNIDKAVESVKSNGGTVIRPPRKSPTGYIVAFVEDPDGNQVELLMTDPSQQRGAQEGTSQK
jgi:predicted enzyme related to lactoylglutathione lyase